MTLQSAAAELRQLRSLAMMVWPHATRDQLDEYAVLAFTVKHGPRHENHKADKDDDFLRSIGIKP